VKQITQRLRDGRIDVIEIPPPVLTRDGVLVDARALGKEYVEAHSAGRSATIEDFRKGRSGQDKGHRAQFAHLHDVLVNGAEPVAPDPLDTMGVTLSALRSAETGSVVTLV
jgi:hypothetical protein